MNTSWRIETYVCDSPYANFAVPSAQPVRQPGATILLKLALLTQFPKPSAPATIQESVDINHTRLNGFIKPCSWWFESSPLELIIHIIRYDECIILSSNSDQLLSPCQTHGLGRWI